MTALREASGEAGWPCLLLGTTSDVDAAASEVLGCFKQEIEITVSRRPSPAEIEPDYRLLMSLSVWQSRATC